MIALRSRLAYLKGGAVPSPMPRSSVYSEPWNRPTSVHDQGDLRITVRASPPRQSPWAPHASQALPPLEPSKERAGPSHGRPAVSFGAPPDDQMSIAASEGELQSSGDEDSAALPPSGSVALPESDPEWTAMLSRAAEKVGLVWNPPPRPEPSRLDDWFLGAGRAGSQRSAPVPFFPEVHEELTRSWSASYSARLRPSGSSLLITLDGGAAKGYVDVPPVERAVAMQLCPASASSWRGSPRLPSKACKFSSGLTAKAYRACGQAASALHAMALLQVHQAQALMDMNEGGSDPELLRELRVATDLALRATKETARSVGQAMSTLVVQERHLWLNLADMRDTDKYRFLDAPLSQVGLFGDAVESFAQQFSAAQKQTEAIRHILPRRAAAAPTRPPAAAPPSTRRRGRPPSAFSAPAKPQQQPSPRPQRGASRRKPTTPVQAATKPGGKRRCKRP